MPPLSLPTIVAFAALTLALCALWIRRASTSSPPVWIYPAAIALLAAAAAHLVDSRGLLALLGFAAVCTAARQATTRSAILVTHCALLAIAGALFVHRVPGFDNPRVLERVLLAPDSEPYTKYLNFDKGAAALFLLGLYVPQRTTSDEGLQHVTGFLWRFAILVAVSMGLAFAVGYVRWDPKLPPWWPVWIWSMVFLTALPEEAIFRGVAQSAIAESTVRLQKSATPIAILTAGVLFGLAHIAGGPSYVLLATVAGIGYGWIYASTRSIGAAIAAHVGLNTIHFLFFSYPALRVP